MANKRTITSANAVFMLSIATLYPIPQQLQGFGADDMFETEDVDVAELVRGADGALSAGFIYSNQPQTVSLMPDSLSNDIFEFWRTSELTLKQKFPASGLITLTGTNKKYTLRNGYLTRYNSIPKAGRSLSTPRRHVITWEAILPALV